MGEAPASNQCRKPGASGKACVEANPAMLCQGRHTRHTWLLLPTNAENPEQVARHVSRRIQPCCAKVGIRVTLDFVPPDFAGACCSTVTVSTIRSAQGRTGPARSSYAGLEAYPVPGSSQCEGPPC